MDNNYLNGVFGHSKEAAFIEWIINKDEEFILEEFCYESNISCSSAKKVIYKYVKLKLIEKIPVTNSKNRYKKANDKFWENLKNALSYMYKGVW